MRDHHRERVVRNDGIAIAEFAAVIHFHRNARQLLDHELAGQRGVPAGPAGHDPDLAEFLELFRRDIHLVEEDAARFLSDPAQGGVPHRARLLVNLFEHEMLVAALFRHDRVPQNVRHLPVNRPAVEIAEAHAFGREHRHVPVAQEKHVARIAQDRRNVRRHEIFVVAQADHHRRSRPRGDNLVGVGNREDRQGEYAGQLLDGGAHRGFKIAAEVLFHQVRNDFGVGLGNELVSLILKLLFEREVVLDDAVVHDHDLAGAIAMGMGIFFGRAAMRRPARVADAVGAIERAQANGVFEVPQLAGSPAHGQPAVFSHHRQPSRIVSAIFQALEPIQNDGHRLARADVADNSAHEPTPSIRDFDLILFDDRISQDVAGERVDLVVGLLPGHAWRKGNVEELALPHVGDAVISQPGQRGSDSLTLWIENRSFQRNKYARLHSAIIAGTLEPMNTTRSVKRRD